MARRITWVTSAQKDFKAFPEAVQEQIVTALQMAAMGTKADCAKPLRGLGSGVLEIALAYRSNAYRAVYAVQIGEDIYVIHAFQKKATKGIHTPKH